MIPFINLKKEYSSLSEELNQKILNILQSGYYILGDEVKKFEEDFSNSPCFFHQSIMNKSFLSQIEKCFSLQTIRRCYINF